MEIQLEDVNEAILKVLNENHITYWDIISCTDKGKLLNIIEKINIVAKEFGLFFSMEKLLYKEFLVLCSTDYKIVITPYYLECLSVS